MNVLICKKSYNYTLIELSIFCNDLLSRQNNTNWSFVGEMREVK